MEISLFKYILKKQSKEPHYTEKVLNRALFA